MEDEDNRESALVKGQTAGSLILPDSTRERVEAIWEAGTAENTRRAYQGDLAYFWAWAGAALGMLPAYPVAVVVVLQFVTDHLAGPEPEVDRVLVEAGVKAKLGPHTLATVRRRCSVLSVAHEGRRVPNPCRDVAVRKLLSKASRAAAARGAGPRKKRAATRDVLDRMLATCGERPIDVRDRALLLFGAASGGRRRSEIAAVQAEDLQEVPGGYVATIRRGKTDQVGEGLVVPVLGRAAEALTAWIAASGVQAGPLFRSVSRRGEVGGGLGDKAVSRIVKRRAVLAGLDAREFGAHSLRSGFVTESGREGVAMGDAMALSGHRSQAVAAGYYQAGAVVRNPAARLYG